MKCTPLAWRVEIYDKPCIVFAATQAKAKWIAVKSYWNAFGRSKVWPRPKASRAQIYDNSALRLQKPQAWSEEYVRDSSKLPIPIVRNFRLHWRSGKTKDITITHTGTLLEAATAALEEEASRSPDILEEAGRWRKAPLPEVPDYWEVLP